MEEELSLDNILGADDIDNLFVGAEENQDAQPEEKREDSEESKDNKKEETTEVNPDSLFDEPESVGSEENNEEQEDTNSKKDGTSPNNFYSSIAKALKDEGIFPDLDDDSIGKTVEPEDFRDLIEQQIKAGLDERQKRIDEALGVGVEPDKIRQYENTLRYIDSITEEQISNEDAQGEQLRKNLIYQDFINRGYSKERAEREVKKSFDAGSDLEDAREALESNKSFFQNNYNKLIQEARDEVAKEQKEKKAQAEKLKTSILEDKNVFGDLSVDKLTRQRIYDNIIKPIYKDPDTGEYFTAIQKYEMENRTDFLKNVSLIFTLTDGFKNIDGLIKGKVKKEVKSSLRDLERTINNTSRASDGSLDFASGSKDSESFFKGYSLDI